MQHLILPFLASVGLPSAFADPLPCSGTCVNTHDPSLFRRGSDGTYYRFAAGGGMPIFSAPSLTGAWTYLGEVLPSGSSIANSGANDAWAPDVQYKDGQYYLYYSVSSFGTQNSAMGVATSPNMDPGTRQPLYHLLRHNLLTFGSFYGDIYQAPLSGDALTWGGGDVYNIEYNATGTRPSEGPFLFEYGDYFYLFWSSGSCCGYDSDRPAPGDEYKVMVCRSSSATGDFVDASGRACTDEGGTLVLGSHGNVYGPGGQSVFNDPSEGPVLVYHYVDTTIGYADGDKRLGINKIDFSSGWPVV
ncbi:glycoside hydrolase family 43 protein [Hortaea werneckii]|nr:glycoside hydrolase family 43 protein [Hortaea werneckii]